MNEQKYKKIEWINKKIPDYQAKRRDLPQMNSHSWPRKKEWQ